MVKRPYPPGQQGQERGGRLSEYGYQLREKQKLKKTYGVLERQFRKYFEESSRKKGVIGDNLMRALELRLDNIVYRLSFASSRCQARQMVRHGFFEVNGKKVDIPSYTLKKGDEVKFRENKANKRNVEFISKSLDKKSVPLWLELDIKNISGKVMEEPKKDQIDTVTDVKAIVELYSK